MNRKRDIYVYAQSFTPTYILQILHGKTMQIYTISSNHYHENMYKYMYKCKY